MGLGAAASTADPFMPGIGGNGCESGGILETGPLLLLADGAGLGKRGFLSVLFDRYGGLALLALMGNPAHLIAIELLIEPDTDDTGTGIADRDHVFVGADLAKLLLYLVAPADRRQQTGVTPTTFLIGEKLRVRLAKKTYPDVPAMGSLGFLVDTGDVFMLFQQQFLFSILFHVFPHLH